ncbi:MULTISPECIES: nitroreductase family protein [Nostocales]|uniref:Nitroreductase n=3 Tax=Nostocales TaxID=1161 RepID=A0A0C1N3L1_9CYAN|nr:nitroreductase family protein [Tolypothrix bouteillei]KAF3889585.1 nitroreductase family protein [Tolypothrix bouteillei VB521301]
MTHKLAATEYPIHDLIRRRWSPRAFADRPVEQEKLLTLLEAARWAPSSYNHQPWSFIVATKDDPTEHKRLLSTLAELNQGWAKNAPVLILAVAKLYFDDGRVNRHALHDVGLALENLVIQATAFGLSVHQIAGFNVESARKQYKIPEGYEPTTALAVGYPGDPQSLSNELRERELAPRIRKPLKQLVFFGEWGKASPLLAASSHR